MVERPMFGLLPPPPVTLSPLTTRSTNGGSAGGSFKFVDWGQDFLGSSRNGLQEQLLGTALISTVSAIDGRGRQRSQAMVYT